MNMQKIAEIAKSYVLQEKNLARSFARGLLGINLLARNSREVFAISREVFIEVLMVFQGLARNLARNSREIAKPHSRLLSLRRREFARGFGES